MPLLNKEYGNAKDQIDDALSFIEDAERLRRNCQEILQERRDNPSLEPCFEKNEILDITDFCQLAPDEDLPADQESSVFRLEFGPPKSTQR